jgi:hypothetical protein
MNLDYCMWGRKCRKRIGVKNEVESEGRGLMTQPKITRVVRSAKSILSRRLLERMASEGLNSNISLKFEEEKPDGGSPK